MSLLIQDMGQESISAAQVHKALQSGRTAGLSLQLPKRYQPRGDSKILKDEFQGVGSFGPDLDPFLSILFLDTAIGTLIQLLRDKDVMLDSTRGESFGRVDSPLE